VEASYLFVFDKSNSNVKEDYHSKMGTNINQNGNDHLKEVQMKTSMMKLSVFVMMAAIAMFTLVAMASADDHKWKHGIKGDYAVTVGQQFKAICWEFSRSTRTARGSSGPKSRSPFNLLRRPQCHPCFSKLPSTTISRTRSQATA
jgi:hypothetical protein